MMVSRCLVGVLAISFALAAFAVDPAWNYANANWLSTLPDSTKLSELSMPSAHNAGVANDTAKDYYIAYIVNVRQYGTCQYGTIGTQLATGVRFFDLRMKRFLSNGNANDFSAYHGGNFTVLSTEYTVAIEGQQLGSCLDEVVNFLVAHPTETAVLRFSHWDSYDDKSPCLNYVRQKLAGRLVTKTDSFAYLNDITLRELRGKALVVVEDVSSSLLGNGLWSLVTTTSYSDTLGVYDDYANKDTFDEMWADQKAKWSNWSSMSRSRSLYMLCWQLTLQSFSTESNGERADKINPKLSEKLDEGLAKGWGQVNLVNADYFDEDLCRTVINLNQWIRLREEAKVCTVTFDANGKNAMGMPDPQNVQGWYTATAPTSDPTANGYTFTGWYTTAACTTKFNFTNTKITQATTVYAGWTPITYTITYTLDGGSASNPSSYTIETAAFALVNPTKNGYSFAGWTGTGLSSTSPSVTIAKGSTGNRSYTAKWTTETSAVSFAVATAQQRYPWNGKVDIVVTLQGTQADVADVECTFAATNNDKKVAVPIGHVARNGPDTGSATTWTRHYVWDADADDTDEIIDNLELFVGLLWRAYTITYSLNGGTVATQNPKTYTRSSPAITLVNPTKAGYTFTGWTGTDLNEKTMSVTIPAGSTGNRSYTANWEEGVQLWANGPCWAECNVGASKPEEYGYYFWWGDTVGYKRNAANNGCVSVKDGTAFSFTQENCKTYNKSVSELQTAGYIDSTGNLAAGRDAARAHCGGSWRIPTDAEIQGLINNCTRTWTKRSNVNGWSVTGKGAYASKSIFLPAATTVDGTSYTSTGVVGSYWTSTPHSSDPIRAWNLYYSSYSGEFGLQYYARWHGRSVRPVRSVE